GTSFEALSTKQSLRRLAPEVAHLAAAQGARLLRVPENVGRVQPFHIVLVDASANGHLVHVVAVAHRDRARDALEVDEAILVAALVEHHAETMTAEVGDEVRSPREALENVGEPMDGALRELVAAAGTHLIDGVEGEEDEDERGPGRARSRHLAAQLREQVVAVGEVLELAQVGGAVQPA